MIKRIAPAEAQRLILQGGVAVPEAKRLIILHQLSRHASKCLHLQRLNIKKIGSRHPRLAEEIVNCQILRKKAWRYAPCQQCGTISKKV